MEEGEVFLMKRYFDKAKLMDGLKHANKRDLVVETKSGGGGSPILVIF